MDRRLLVLALGMFALGTDSFVVANLGTALAPDFSIALASRALAGLGAAMFSPTATGAAASLVPPEKRGHALSIVTAGLAVSTALGAPIGTLIGGFGDWHWTMVFVAALAAASGIGVLAFLSRIPMPPPISLAKRLAPLADIRIGLTLLTTFLFFSAAFTIYTYFAVVFEGAIGGNPATLAGLLVLWGAAGTIANLFSGRLIDRIGPHKVLVAMLSLVLADFILLPFTGGTLALAIPAVLVWGACGWGSSVPQQHRIVGIAPQIAPVVLGLNNSAVFLGTTAAGVIGAAGIEMFGGERLGTIAAVLVAAAMLVSQIAARRIAAAGRRNVEAAA